MFVTEVIKVTDTEKVTYTGFTLTEVDSKDKPVYVLSNTKIPGYISPTSAGAEVEVTFKGTELNVFMEFASSNAQITYSVDGGEPVAKTLSDTNHPLQLVSNLPNTEHTVKITFVNAYKNVKIGAFFVGSVNVDEITVTYMDGETEVATQTYAYGELLVHPEYEIAPSETPGNIRKWNVPEGTLLTEDITVELIDTPITPLAIASGRDMRFKFNSDGVPGIFMRGRGFTKGEVTYDANGDEYTETLYDPEFAFKPETGNWFFKEDVNGWYRADGSQYITAYLNASSASKYIAIRYKLHAPNGVYEKGITVTTDTGNVTVPATYVNDGEFHTLILDVTNLPAGSKNIRSLKIHPWSDALDPTEKEPNRRVPVANGSYFDLHYIAAFESLEEAEGYTPAAYVAPEQYDITINAHANATITVDDVSITDTFTAKYYADENVYITITPNVGFKFIGWSDGNDIVTPDGTEFLWGRDDNKVYTINGAVFAVDGALTLTPVFEEIKHTVTFKHGEEIIETVEYREGTALVYPEYDIPASDKEGYVCVWDVAEGTAVMSDLTVSVIEREITPTAVRAGEDIKFTFNTFTFPINFYGIYGTIQKNNQTVTANGDSYTAILYDLNSAFNYETGLWEMYENISGYYEPDAGNFVTAFVNLPANTKYITLGVSVKAVETKAFVGNLEVTSDKGTIEVPVDFTGIDGDIAKFVLDVRSLPADSKNIRSVKIWPWQKEKDKTHIRPGSFIKIEHIAGFETLVEANAYEYSYTAPEKYAVSLDATEGGSFTVDKVGPKTEYSAEHYENEIVFLTATADAGYTFAGWYNGEEKVTGDYATSWYSKNSSHNVITVTGDAFKVTDALALTAKFEPIYRNLKVEAIGNATLNGTFTVNGSEAVSTFDGNAHEAHYTELVAIAPAGLKFEGWYNITDGKNILLARTEELSLYITGDMAIEARFMDETISMPVKLSVTIGSEEDAGGTIIVGDSTDNREDYFDYVSSGRPTTITAVPNSGKKVAYWVRVTNSSGTEVLMATTDKLDAYPLGAEVTYKPVFVSETAKINLYVDYANKVIGSVIDGVGEEPAVPERLGYIADKWVPGDTVDGVTVYRATYTKPATGNYALTIKYADGTVVTYGNEEGATNPALKYNDQVTLATENANVAWTITKIGDSDANIVMSYKEEYTFNYSFTNNMVIEEKTASGDDVVLDTVEAIYDPNAGLIKFVGVFELPTGATHVDHGILLTANAEIGGSEELFKLNTGADIIVGRIRNNTHPTPAFVINKNNVESGATWYGRAYLVYTIGEETYEVYGDTISCKAE